MGNHEEVQPEEIQERFKPPGKGADREFTFSGQEHRSKVVSTARTIRNLATSLRTLTDEIEDLKARIEVLEQRVPDGGDNK